MTQEEKAKRYDEALIKAKALYSQPLVDNTFLETFFSELKESEDKETRKSITEFFKNYSENGTWKAIPDVTKWIAWLEKQKTSEEALQYLRENHSSSEMSDFQAAMNIAVAKAYDKGYNDGLEKGKKKSIGDLTQQEAMDIAVAKCFEQGEKKPADKVEPKFKVGDWIVRSAEGFKHNTYLVTEVKDYYVCEDLKGRRVTFTFNDVHKNFKLWDISDAKDGDVLSFNDGHGNDSIELIKSITGKKIEFWFCLTNGNRYEVFDGITPYTNLISREDATPATKEQRDTLLKAMTDAGYTFDFEKKELKKIEQNPAWSEEDKEKLNRIYMLLPQCIDCHPRIIGDRECVELQDWLKSLRPQNTWKPSYEQIEALESATENCAYSDYQDCLRELIGQLKELKG